MRRKPADGAEGRLVTDARAGGTGLSDFIGDFLRHVWRGVVVVVMVVAAVVV